MTSEPLRLDLFEKRTEWPLAIAAVVFLAAYSVRGARVATYSAPKASTRATTGHSPNA